LFILWALSLIACVILGVLLVQFYKQSTVAQIERAEAVLGRACSLVQDRYAFAVSGLGANAASAEGPELRQTLTATVSLALAHEPDVEGGIWQEEAESLAYAYPTYEGSSPKTDLPAAELDRIRDVNEQALRAGRPVIIRSTSRSQTLLLLACPLDGPLPGVTGWTMTRIEEAPGYDRLRLGLGILLALVVGMSGWLSVLVLSWSRRIRGIEQGLTAHATELLPAIALTGDYDLDRIVGALNEAGARLRAARNRSDALAVRVAAAERLAALGRVAAGVAHEIRNPIAAMRLKAENALAGDDARRRTALDAILGQIARLERLVTEMLAMTQRREPATVDTDVAAFLASCVDTLRDTATARGVALAVETRMGRAIVDPDLVRRALENLVLNAIQHSPSGSTVTLSAGRQGDGLRFAVADAGPGVAPEIAADLFEPFVTGRADGTGLGLAIARELAEAHGGRLQLLDAGGSGRGATFALDLPWPRS
jgi:signal transduction histidine kinase